MSKLQHIALILNRLLAGVARPISSSQNRSNMDDKADLPYSGTIPMPTSKRTQTHPKVVMVKKKQTQNRKLQNILCCHELKT